MLLIIFLSVSLLNAWNYIHTKVIILFYLVGLLAIILLFTYDNKKGKIFSDEHYHIVMFK